jgi:hypothetical protein
VRVAASAKVGIVELVVDPPGTADLVMDGAREPGRHRLAGLSSQYASPVDCGWLTRRAGNVVIELLGCGKFGARARTADTGWPSLGVPGPPHFDEVIRGKAPQKHLPASGVGELVSGSTPVTHQLI